MFDSGVLTTAYADVVLPATADAEEGAAVATQNIGMLTHGMISTGVDSDLTDAARHLRFRADV